MSDWKTEWNDRLTRPPLKRRRFSEDLMLRVEGRLRADERAGRRRTWGKAAAVAVPVVLLAALGGVWYGAPAWLPTSPVDEPGRVVPAVPVSGFQGGEGGGIDWWASAAERVPENEADRTIITFVQALLERRLGVWGGPSPDIWETPEVKRSLEGYDVSSPWAYMAYVDAVSAAEGHSVYRLRILLRDSVPTVFTETVDVRVRGDTHKIDAVAQVGADETGTPVEAATLVEDPTRDLTISGYVFPGEGMYRPIRVRYGAAEKTFGHWENVNNETYLPRIETVKAGASEEEMISVLLTRGYGTGLYLSEAKMLRNDLSEIPVADALQWTEDRLLSETTVEEGKRMFRISLNGETRAFEYNEEDAGLWFDRAAVGSVVIYAVEGEALHATVAVQVSPGHFPVSVRLKYEYDGTVFTVAEAALEEEMNP